jgi:bla regulator protein BlaR1
MEFQWLNFLPSDWVNALYSALFHSLWIGMVMAVVAGMVIIGTRNSRPSLRYNLLTALLGVFSLTMIFIFYQSLNKANQFSAYLKHDVAHPNQLFKLNIFNDIDRILSVLGSYANQMILIWLGIIFIKAIKLMIGFQGVHHLKHTKVFDAGAYWQKKVNELSKELYIKQSVQILQSGIAKIPMVIGHFKPIILMPIGMLNHLSLTEVEAILSHELAHIKRRDYLVNILQNILEVLFFFNPAVLWLSKIIKEERENCCDDLAISCTNDKNGYLKALVSCQEFNLNSTGFAMSMANGKSQLISRIRRIAFNKKASLGGVEKTMLTMSLVIVLLLSTAFILREKPAYIAKTTTKQLRNAVDKVITKIKTTNAKPMQPLKPLVPANLAVPTIPTVEITALNELKDIASTAENNNERTPNEAPETCVKVAPIKSVEFYVPPISKTVSTSISTTTSTVKVDGRVVVHVVHQGKDAREDIRKDMLKDSIIVTGENPIYILNQHEMLVNGVRQDACTHQKYKDKYITRPDTQYRIGS